MPNALLKLTKFLKKPRNLAVLDLSESNTSNDINANKLRQLANACQQASPRKLSLNITHFGLAEYRAVMNIIHVPGNRISALELLSDSEMKPEIMQIIVTGIKTTPRLRELSLRNSFIGNNAATVLADGLPFTAINVCHLTNCDILTEGLISLLRVLPLTKITSLLMDGSRAKMNIECGTAVLLAAKNCLSLIKLTLPQDDNPAAVELAQTINTANMIIKERDELVREWAYTIFQRHLPIRVFGQDDIVFFQRPTLEAIRVSLIAIYRDPSRELEVAGLNIDTLVNESMHYLQCKIAEYYRLNNRVKLLGRSDSTVIPEADEVPEEFLRQSV